ncbi:MAG: GTPase HflX, partial [candidate division WOR-3 bacterium]
LTVRLPYKEGELTAAFHRHGIVDKEEFQVQGTLITGRLPARLVSLYDNYRVTDKKKAIE